MTVSPVDLRGKKKAGPDTEYIMHVMHVTSLYWGKKIADTGDLSSVADSQKHLFSFFLN